MKIAVLQMKTLLAEQEKNEATLHAMAAEAMQGRPDVLVLPELWHIGFYPRPIAAYADANGETAHTLAALAQRHQVNIVGGTIARLDKASGKIRNTCHVFDRTGRLVASYDKAHLFSPSGENDDFTAGDSLCTFTLDGVPCAVAVCYDIRFGAFIAKLAQTGATVLFVPAAWPKARASHWQTLIRARAIEQQLFVTAANEAGEEPAPLAGHSALIGPWGEVLAEAGEGQEIISVELRLETVQQARDRLPMRRDRRQELY